MTFWDILKLIGPYLFEVLKIILSGPHAQAVENLKARGLIKDGPPVA